MKTYSSESVLDYSELSGSPTNIVIPVLYKRMLRYLSDKTRIRQSEYLREAIRDVLIKYRQEFRNSEFQF